MVPQQYKRYGTIDGKSYIPFMVPLYAVAKVAKREKVTQVAKAAKVEEIEKLKCSIKISETNNRKLTALAGKLQSEREIKQTPNDAVTYLFEIKEEKEKNES